MKLNHECMRAVLLHLESVPTIEIDDDGSVSFSEVWLSDVFESLPRWCKEDVFYSLFNLEQGGYIDYSQHGGDGYVDLCVNYITLRGHEFLDTIRDDNRWGAIKKGLSSVRDYSLSAISSIAEGMTSGAVNAYLAQR